MKVARRTEIKVYFLAPLDTSYRTYYENLNSLFERSGEFTEEFLWDFKSNLTTSKGSTVKLSEFLDSKVIDNVNGYVERSSGSYGLANSIDSPSFLS